MRVAEAEPLAEPGLHLSSITRFDDLAALRGEWLALEAAAGIDLPFQTWEWAVAWWKHLREDSRGVRDHLRVCVIRDAQLRVVAIAPFILTERPAVGPLRVRYVQFIGADPNITEIRGWLCLQGFEERCANLLRAHFAQRADDWHWIAWEGTPAHAATDFRSNHRDSPLAEKSSFVLDLPGDWHEMKRQLSRNIKQSLRKCYNSLRRDGLSSSLEVVKEPLAIRGALADFFRLHTQRAAHKSGLKHNDVFGSDAARAFLIEACEELSRRGITRVFRLRVKGQVVAVRIAFQMGDQLYLYYSGWEEAFGRYSIMTTLLAEIIQHAIANGMTAVNLSTSKDVAKTRWRPREVMYASRIEISAQRRASIRYFGFRAVRSLRRLQITRQIMPAFVLRKSEPPKKFVCAARLLRLSSGHSTRLHSMAVAAVALVALDLLDGILDHKLLLLPSLFEQFVG